MNQHAHPNVALVRNLTPEQIVIAVEREIGLRSFYEFVCLAWPHIPGETRYDETRVHKVVCDALEKVGTGEIRNLLINIPPGLGKSIIVGVLWPIWHWMVSEVHEDFLFTSFDIELMWRDSERSGAVIDDPWFQARWGDKVRRRPSKSGTDKIGNWATQKNGLRLSASIGGKITGKHPDIAVIDDPTKPLDATAAELQRSRTFFSGTLASRRKDARTIRRVCIMQRIAEGDLSGLLEEIGWTVVRIPFLYDSRIASEHDWRTEEGESIDPVRYPPEVIAEIRRDADAAGGDVFDTQWQQNPAPPGGLIFETDWLSQTYHPGQLPPPDQIDACCISFDLTFKGERQSKKSDYVAGHAWARVGNNYFLLWRVYGKWSFVQSLDAFRAMSELYPWILAKLVEDKANGPALEDVLHDEIEGIILVDPGGKSKEARAYAETPIFRSMRVFLPAGAPWLNEYKNNMQRFPKAKNDDDVDATTQALRYLRSGVAWEGRYKGMAEAAKIMGAG